MKICLHSDVSISVVKTLVVWTEVILHVWYLLWLLVPSSWSIIRTAVLVYLQARPYESFQVINKLRIFYVSNFFALRLCISFVLKWQNGDYHFPSTWFLSVYRSSWILDLIRISFYQIQTKESNKKDKRKCLSSLNISRRYLMTACNYGMP